MNSHKLDIYLLSFYTNCGQLKHFSCPLDVVWAAHIQATTLGWCLEKQELCTCFSVAQKMNPLIPSEFS